MMPSIQRLPFSFYHIRPDVVPDQSSYVPASRFVAKNSCNNFKRELEIYEARSYRATQIMGRKMFDRNPISPFHNERGDAIRSQRIAFLADEKCSLVGSVEVSEKGNPLTSNC